MRPERVSPSDRGKEEIEERQIEDEELRWLIEYLTLGVTPKDEVEARRIAAIASEYVMINDCLYHYRAGAPHEPRPRRASQAASSQARRRA